MRKITLLLLLTLAPIFAFTQAEVSVGPPYKVIDAGTKKYFSRGNEMLSVKIDGKRVFIQKFSIDDLTLKQIKEYTDFDNSFTYEDIYQLSDKYYLFYSCWDKSNEIEQLFYREIDFASGSFVGTGTNILKVPHKISGSLSSGFHRGEFQIAGGSAAGFNVTGKFAFHFSDDDSKILVQYLIKPESKKEEDIQDIIGFNVFDNNLTLLWKKEITMPYTVKKMKNIDYTVDSQGNVYNLAKVHKPNTAGATKIPNYDIQLLKFAANSGELTKTNVELANKFITQVGLYESPNPNEMICAGFYNNGTDKDAAKGILIIKLSKDGKILASNSYEIPLEIINQNLSEFELKRNAKEKADNVELSDLELRKLIIETDGSLILIGEQHLGAQGTSTASTPNGGTTTIASSAYYYDDILVTKIDANQKLVWMRKLPKKQVGRFDKGGMGFKYIQKNNDHYFIYLDHKDNINLNATQEPKTHNDGHGGMLTAYKLTDSTGEVSKFSIVDIKDIKGTQIAQFKTERVLTTSNNQLVIEAYKRDKEDILIKILFEK